MARFYSADFQYVTGILFFPSSSSLRECPDTAPRHPRRRAAGEGSEGWMDTVSECPLPLPTEEDFMNKMGFTLARKRKVAYLCSVFEAGFSPRMLVIN